ncbi:MAG TPA: hypothetical protein PK280_18455 [Planctomycetota bacterium]|nr:hypothetical protein [Planctomycetota bacterium]
MPAILPQIADAVAAELNSATLSMPVTAVRAYQPIFELADMKTLHVTVVPKGLEQELGSRGSTPREAKVDVAVQKKLATTDPAEVDPLMQLVEEIAAVFKLKRLAHEPLVVWVKTENVPIYSQEHMAELRQFTSVLTFTFRIME